MQQTSTPAQPAAGAQVPSQDLLPLSHVAAELGISYHATRDLALRGRLEVRFIGHRLYVTAASVVAFKARN